MREREREDVERERRLRERERGRSEREEVEVIALQRRSERCVDALPSSTFKILLFLFSLSRKEKLSACFSLCLSLSFRAREAPLSRGSLETIVGRQRATREACAKRRAAALIRTLEAQRRLRKSFDVASGDEPLLSLLRLARVDLRWDDVVGGSGTPKATTGAVGEGVRPRRAAAGSGFEARRRRGRRRRCCCCCCCALLEQSEKKPRCRFWARGGEPAARRAATKPVARYAATEPVPPPRCAPLSR